MEAVREKRRTKSKKPRQAVATKDEEPTKEEEIPPQEVVVDKEVLTKFEEKTSRDAEEQQIDVVPEEPAPSAPTLEEDAQMANHSLSEIEFPPEVIEKRPAESPIKCACVEVVEVHSPSAPELCDLDFYQIQQINQQILNEITHFQSEFRTESRSKSSSSSIQLPPFTDLERNQYYFNPKLGTVLSFEVLAKKHFTDQHDQMQNFQLYRELSRYLSLQLDIHNLNMDLQQLKNSFQKIREKIWVVQKVTKTFSTKCPRDNCGAVKSRSVTFLQGTYSKNWATSFTESLENFVNICCEKLRGKVILRDLQMLTISDLVQNIIDQSTETPKRDVLRLTLTTLFHFVVKKTITKDFRENVKSWLERVIVVFNKFSLLDDQLFLVANVLRFPTTEAAQQVIKSINIAVPGRNNGSDTIDDWLAVLWMSLRPIKQWQKKNSNEQAAEKDTNWEIVDSDGEDTEEDGGDLRFPNEVVFLDVLDRIPFRRIFEDLLDVREMQCSDFALSAHGLLRVIIFSSAFVDIVTEGLSNYHRDRYKTFLKRLAAIVKWNADLVTALYDLYRSSALYSDAMVLERLETEYNIFMVRVCRHLWRNKSVLQYLSQLKFARLTVNTYWKLNYYLLTTFPDNLEVDFHADFRQSMRSEFSFTSSQCTISQWSEEELYFILEALTSLAIGCGGQDEEFVNRMVRNIFHIGFLMDVRRDDAHKTARDMVMSIAGSYPSVIEVILEEIQRNLSVIDNQSLYLLKVLPYDDWRPSMDTIEIISDLLENYALDSGQHNIGKLLVSYMNWGFSEDAPNGHLVLGHEYHCKVALAVLSATIKKFPKLESYKKVTLAGIDADPEKRYVAWAWKMMTKLKLHSMDQGVTAKLQKIENNAIQVMPTIVMEFIPAVHRLVTVDENPLAIYTALLMCDVGNSVDKILDQGLPLLVKLLDNTPYFIINRCLELIVPLFLNSADALIKSESCAKVIESVLAEEKSLLGIQLVSWKPNDVIVQFAEMVVNQILELSTFGWNQVQNITWLWTMLLTRKESWYTNYNYLFVLENILKISATIPGLLDRHRDYFYPLILELKLKQPGRKSFISKNMTLFPWCTLLFIELDYLCYEQVPNIWSKFVDRVSGSRILDRTTSGHDKPNYNQVLKDLTNDYTMSELCVFKWMDFLLKLDSNCEVFSVALVQYWRMAKDWPYINEYNSGLLGKLESKLDVAENDFRKRGIDDKDPTRKRVLLSLKDLCSNVAKKNDAGLENSVGNQQSFVLDYLHMTTLRDEIRKLSQHWKLISFRQDIKRRATPSTNKQWTEVPLKEKRLRIIELIKTQRDPTLFTVSEVREFDLAKILREANMGNNFWLLLSKIMSEWKHCLSIVERQVKLENQLYITKTNSYHQSVYCCTTSVNIPIRYEELVKSNVDGDANLKELVKCHVDENDNRDNVLVKYFFSVLYKLRISITMCQDGDHSSCSEMNDKCLEMFIRFEEGVIRKLTFVGAIVEQIKESMQILTRRHCSQFSNATIKVIFKNPSMAAVLMEMLHPEEMDDSLYQRNLQRLLLNYNSAALESCLALMKISDRLSRAAITESYKVSVIKLAFEYLPNTRKTLFVLLAREVFIVMLRRIELFPVVMKLTFQSGKTKDLLEVLFQTLGLPIQQSGTAELPLERLNQIDHLFTYEAIEWAMVFLTNSPMVAVDVYFYEFLSYMLIRKNTLFVSQQIHSKIADMYHPQITDTNGRSNSSQGKVIGSYFRSLGYIPDFNYLGHELRKYLNKFSGATESPETMTIHREYAAEMNKLDWRKFDPNAEDLAWIHRSLWTQTEKGHLSVVQSVIASVVVRIDWKSVIERWQINLLEVNNLTRMFLIAIRIPYELSNTNNENALWFYESIQELPWASVTDQSYSEGLDWIVMSVPQLPFIPKLGSSEGDTVERRVLGLLLQCAEICGPNLGPLTTTRDSRADPKRRRLVTAMIRMFSMSTSGLMKNVQEALKTFLDIMMFHFQQGGMDFSSELEYFQGELLKLLDDKALSGPYLSVLQSYIDKSDNEWFVESFLKSTTNVDVVTKTRVKLFEILLRNYFQKCIGNETNPWQAIEGMSLKFIIRMRLDHLKDMEQFLSLHLFVACKLKMCETVQQRITFVDEFVTWLANIPSREESEAYLLLLWSQAVCVGSNIHFAGGGSEILEKSQKYLKSSCSLRNEGWGKSLFTAIGLAKVQKQELCLRYIVYLMIKCFPELRESTTESSVKFVQQFEGDIKSSKMSNFKAQLDDLFGSGQRMVPDSRENFNVTLIQFIRVIYTTTGCGEWFKNVHDFWR